MKAIGVIPARYEASRYPGKVLADLFGKPMIQYVYEEALKTRLLDELIVATDDERVRKAVEGFGGKVVVTAKEHTSGTDRIAEVANPVDAGIIINIQGDEPLIHYSMIDELVRCLSDDETIPMATIIHKLDDPEDLKNPSVVKVVKDKHNFALYFSRSPIPYLREPLGPENPAPTYYKHIGLYAYTKDFLFTFKNLPTGELERAEKLEQLRALERGYKIKVIESAYDTVGVDRPEDLEKVKQRMAAKI